MEQIFNHLVSFSYEWAEALVNGLWLGLLLTGLIVLAFRFGRRPDGATGYTIWLTALITITFMPLLVSFSGVGLFESSGRNYKDSFAATSQVEQTNQIANQTSTDRPRQTAIAANHKKQIPSKQATPAGISVSTPTNKQMQTNASISIGSLLLKLLPAGILLMWFMVTGALLVRIGFAAVRIRTIKRSAQPLDMKYYPYLKDIIKSQVKNRKVIIATSDLVDIPMAAGLGQPMVLLPADLVEDLSAHDLKAILLHEMAHLRRWDDWTKLIQKVVEAIMFFHPAVIWIGRQLDIQRELACDDAVIEVTGQPNDYARCLTRLAQTSSPTPTSLMPGVLSGREQIFNRIARLVNPGSNSKISKKRVISMVIALIVTVILSLQVVPVIAFPAASVSLNQLSLAVQSWAVETDKDEDKAEAEEQEKRETQRAERLADKKRQASEENNNVKSYRVTKKSDQKSGKRNSTYYQLSDETSKSLESSLRRVEESMSAQESKMAEQARKLYQQEAKLSRQSSKDYSRALGEYYRVLERTSNSSRSSNRTRVPRTARTYKEWHKLLDLKDLPDHSTGPMAFEDGRFVPLADISNGSGYSYFYLNDDDDDEDYTRAPKVGYFDNDRSGYVYLSGLDNLTDLSELSELSNLSELSELSSLSELSGLSSLAVLSELSELPSLLALPDVPSAPRVYSYNSGGLLDNLFGSSHGTTITNNNNGHTSITWNSDRSKISVEYDGEIELTDDGQSIKSISKRGYVSIYHKRGSWRREIDIEQGSDGELEYYYEVDGDEEDFDAAGQEWLEDILLDVFRKTGFASEQRVAIILKNDGVDGVLDETLEIESDWITRLYFQELIATADVNESEHERILDQIDRDMDSDYEKAEMLIYLADEVGDTEKLFSEYLTVLKSLDSDYETRRVLSSVGIGRNADDKTILAVLELADQMDSDYEKAELLIDIARNCRNSTELTTAYTKACRRIDSSYELRRVLQALGHNSKMDETSLAEIIQMAEMMESDYEKAELLIEFSDVYRGNKKLTNQLLEAAATLESDYETRRVLESFDIDCKNEPELAEKLLRIASRMSSDYEQAELLLDWAECARTSEKALDNYLSAVDRLGSDYERQRVILELIDTGELDRELTMSLLLVTEDISSDYEKALVLKELMEEYKSDDLQDEFEDVLESISSDYERDRLYRKLYKKSRRDRSSGR